MNDDDGDVEQIEKEKVEQIVYEYRKQLEKERQLAAVFFLATLGQALIFAGYVAGFEPIVVTVDSMAAVASIPLQPPILMLESAGGALAAAFGPFLWPVVIMFGLVNIYAFAYLTQTVPNPLAGRFR